MEGGLKIIRGTVPQRCPMLGGVVRAAFRLEQASGEPADGFVVRIPLKQTDAQPLGRLQVAFSARIHPVPAARRRRRTCE